MVAEVQTQRRLKEKGNQKGEFGELSSGRVTHFLCPAGTGGALVSDARRRAFQGERRGLPVETRARLILGPIVWQFRDKQRQNR